MNPLLIPWFRLDPIDIPGPIDIQPFGILVAIGILVGTRVAEWRGERIGVPRELVTNFLFFVIVVGFISSMVLNVVMYEPEKIAKMLQGEFSYPGLTTFGGLFGGAVAALYYGRRHRVSIMVLGDIFCFAFPFAWLFGRSGCFVVHDHPGLPSDFFLAVDNYYGMGVARHDLGLYEVLWSAAAIALVMFLQRKPRPFGFFMGVVPMFYAVIRFGLDFLRESPTNGGDIRYFGFTPGHYWSIIMFITGLVILRRSFTHAPSSAFINAAPSSEKATPSATMSAHSNSPATAAAGTVPSSPPPPASPPAATKKKGNKKRSRK